MQIWTLVTLYPGLTQPGHLIVVNICTIKSYRILEQEVVEIA